MFGLLLRLRAEIVPLDEEKVRLASVAYQMYGKGNYPAKPKFGDCLTYAAARVRGARLLYVGEDSAPTDIVWTQSPR